jgi:hypothetical protein
MARATGNARSCGNCPHVYDVAVTVTIRVPEPSGGFRLMQATKEIDTTLEQGGMSEAQFKRFLPHRTAMAESKAFMRAIRAALGLAGTYPLEELKKPFVVARIVPNLDAPEIKNAVANNYLQSLGMLFEMPAQAAPQQALAAPGAEPEAPAQLPEKVPEFPDEEGAPPWEAPPEDEPDWEPTPPGYICADCGCEITETRARNGKVWSPEAIAGYSQKSFGRYLCTACQDKAKGARR